MLEEDKKCLALIPARSGSKRVPNKNIKILGGQPLLAYTIKAALEAEIFSHVIVSTDSQEIKNIALKYGAEVPFLRPKELALDSSPDIEWVKYTLNKLKEQGIIADFFALLRPTSPFRRPATIKRAYAQFLAVCKHCDSLRAVEKCKQHPAKMWKIKNNLLEAIMPNPDENSTPWHSSPYQSLPEIYVQNASLEISWCKTPMEKNTIAGKRINPFLSESYEGFDINNLEDWWLAERLMDNKEIDLES